MEKTVEGIVQMVSRGTTKEKNEPRFGIKLTSGAWYNSLGTTEAQQGDKVRLHFEENKYGNDIRSMEILPVERQVIQRQPTDEDYWARRNRVIGRQACMKIASELELGFYNRLPQKDLITDYEAYVRTTLLHIRKLTNELEKFVGEV